MHGLHVRGLRCHVPLGCDRGELTVHLCGPKGIEAWRSAGRELGEACGG